MGKSIGRPALPVAIGQRFQRLTVVRQGPASRSGDRRWWCECDCGRACARIRQRCENPSDISYPDYGGRGIRVCQRWQTFEPFLADMGPRPGRGYSIERIDVDGNYTPENCIWATTQQQARNKRVSIWIEHNGERLHIKEWEQRTGISWSTLRHRYVDLSWSAERTLTTPPEAFAQRGSATWNGETLTLTEWSQRTGIPMKTLHHRLRVAGWSVERALSEPVARRSNNKKPGS